MSRFVLIVAGLCLLGSVPANAAAFIKLADRLHTFDDPRYGRMTVCEFKNVVAERLGELDTPEKFTLMMRGRDLPGDVTLNSLGFERDISIVVGKAGEESEQC